MKNKTTKIIIILMILLTTIVSFVGIYGKDKGTIKNQLKEYQYETDLTGKKEISLELDTSKKEIIKDSEGKIIENATEDEIKEKGYVKEEQPVNKEESLTEANYKKQKEILQKRLEKIGFGSYAVRLNEANGKIVVEIPEDDNTEELSEALTTVGKLEIIDTQTKEVLLSNKQIKDSQVYRNQVEKGISIAFTLEFNDEGKKKLEEITKTYVKTKSESNTTTQNTTTQENATDAKTITMKIDDSEVMTTGFEQPLTDGIITLTSGDPSTDLTEINTNIAKARRMSAIFANEPLELKYNQKESNYIQEPIKNVIEERFVNIVEAIIIIAGIVFIIRFKAKGILATMANAGFVGLLLLIIRYWNVALSMDGIVAMILVTILNTVLTNRILCKLKEQKDSKEEEKTTINKELIKFISITMPIFIASVIFAFAKASSTRSFGMVMFWGLLIATIYNVIITKNLIRNVGGNINEQK